MDKVKEKIERNKEKAKIFLNKNIKVFISDINGNYFFCKINSIKEDYLVVKGFAGKRKLEMDKIYFLDIVRLEEYKELEDLR